MTVLINLEILPPMDQRSSTCTHNCTCRPRGKWLDEVNCPNNDKLNSRVALWQMCLVYNFSSYYYIVSLFEIGRQSNYLRSVYAGSGLMGERMQGSREGRKGGGRHIAALAICLYVFGRWKTWMKYLQTAVTWLPHRLFTCWPAAVAGHK